MEHRTWSTTGPNANYSTRLRPGHGPFSTLQMPTVAVQRKSKALAPTLCPLDYLQNARSEIC